MPRAHQVNTRSARARTGTTRSLTAPVNLLKAKNVRILLSEFLDDSLKLITSLYIPLRAKGHAFAHGSLLHTILPNYDCILR